MIYFNGKFLRPEECSLSVMDHAARYGSGAFETFAFDGNSITLWQSHHQRLSRGIEYLGIQPERLPLWSACTEATAKPLTDCARQLLLYHGVSQAVIRYSVYPGPSAQGLTRLDFEHPVETVELRTVSSLHSLDLILLQSVTVRERLPFKSTEYTTHMRGLRELHEHHLSGYEGLLLTRDGFLAEGLFSNLFALLPDGRLWTPPEDPRILRGITAQWVIDTCEQMGVAIVSNWQPLDFLTSASAIFTTNRGRGLLPCNQVFSSKGKSVWTGDSASHSVIKDLIIRYSRED